MLRAGGVLGIVLLTGCQSLPPVFKGAGLGPEKHQIPPMERLMTVLDAFQRGSADDQQRTIALAERRYESRGTSLDQARLALLLALPDTPFEDLERAEGLLEGLLERADDVDSTLVGLARTVRWNIQDRIRWRQAAEARAGDLNRTRGELRALRESLAEEQARREEIEQQLEALKQIEQQLHQRTRFGTNP